MLYNIDKMEIINEISASEPIETHFFKLPWYVINHVKHKENCRRYQREHPEKTKAYCKTWRENNHEKYNEMCKINQRKYDSRKREERKLKKIQDFKATAQ